MKKVLVTGGAGFVGNALTTELLKRGYGVDIIDNLSIGSEAKVHPFANFLGGDIRAMDNIKDTAYDYIFHLACIQIAASSKSPVLDMQVNAQSTLQMLEFIKTNELPDLKRFVYTSSCSVFGSSVKLPATEDDPTKVLSNYAASKLLGENYTMVYGRSYNIPISVVRYSNVYGYGQSPRNPYCGVLGKFVHNALIGEKLSIFGDGEQTRAFSCIDDIVEPLWKSAILPEASNQIINLGGVEEWTINDACKVLQKVIGGGTIEYKEGRHEVKHSIPTFQKSIDILDFNYKTSMKDGLTIMWDWAKKQPMRERFVWPFYELDKGIYSFWKTKK